MIILHFKVFPVIIINLIPFDVRSLLDIYIVLNVVFGRNVYVKHRYMCKGLYVQSSASKRDTFFTSVKYPSSVKLHKVEVS